MEGNTIKVKKGEKESNKCNGCRLRIKEPKTKRKGDLTSVLHMGVFSRQKELKTQRRSSGQVGREEEPDPKWLDGTEIV